MMISQTKTFNKIAKALEALGYEVTREGELYTFVKDQTDFLIDVDEESESFTIVEYVMGPEGALTKEQFDTALDVVKSFHKDYYGDWNEGISYLSSPIFCLKGIPSIPKAKMEEIVKDFDEVFIFMCANACLVTDATMFSEGQ